ncbi:MAG: amidohydrolase family protein [Parvularculaceae bacterium]|nr:amidohydrolase family protein [Parvularculaceae bacterium]
MPVSRFQCLLSATLAIALAPGCGEKQTTATPDQIADAVSADTVYSNGRIYTANDNRAFAEAFAVRGDEIIFAGSKADAAAFIGETTASVDLEGRLVLPGIHDVHIHPVMSMDVDTCTINKQAMTLAELVGFVSGCVARTAPAPGEWVYIELWEFERGNQPDAQYPTIRAALDAAAPENPVVMEGTDGHHYAANSLALATARNARGETVGLSAATLATEFADLAQYVGVDDAGEPNGKLTESHIYNRLAVEGIAVAELNKRLAHPEKLMDVTLPRGITGFLDAAARPATLPVYDALLDQGKFHARARIALYLDPSAYRLADGGTDFDAMITEAKRLRARYENSPLVRANFLKLFADGVIEGDPLSVPPTLPNAAFSRDYLQPLFEWDEAAHSVKVTGYVDLGSALCADARAGLDNGGIDVAAFIAANGFHPAQCLKNNGVLQDPEDVEIGYVKAGDAAGFTFLIHAIGDRAVKTGLDAIEAARAENGTSTRHTITHLQVVRPEDISRFAPLGIYTSLTFAWAVVDRPYDLSVIPFIDRVDGPKGIYDEDGYYWRNAYPAASLQRAGAVVVAGSDAPVDTRDPRPFVNIEGAVTRSIDDPLPLNHNEAISLFDAVDAYTINAARSTRQDAFSGSIEPGKKADFIIVDQDIFALADAGEADKISETNVLQTWFGGELAYERE